MGDRFTDYIGDHLKTHRMPRILMVTNEGRQDRRSKLYHASFLLPDMINCNCLKFVTIGPDYVHAVIPEDHPHLSQVQVVQDAWNQAQKPVPPYDTGRPYDLIITDSPESYRLMAEWAQTVTPRPGVVQFVPNKGDRECAMAEAARLFKQGIPAFCGQDTQWDLEDEKQIPAYDNVIAMALGKEGLERLQCAGPDCADERWSKINEKPHKKYTEVQMSEANRPRKPMGILGRERQ